MDLEVKQIDIKANYMRLGKLFEGMKDTMVNTKLGFVIVFCEYVEDTKCLKLVQYFWFYSGSKKDQF